MTLVTLVYDVLKPQFYTMDLFNVFEDGMKMSISPRFNDSLFWRFRLYLKTKRSQSSFGFDLLNDQDSLFDVSCEHNNSSNYDLISGCYNVDPSTGGVKKMRCCCLH